MICPNSGHSTYRDRQVVAVLTGFAAASAAACGLASHMKAHDRENTPVARLIRETLTVIRNLEATA